MGVSSNHLFSRVYLFYFSSMLEDILQSNPDFRNTGGGGMSNARLGKVVNPADVY